MFIFDCVFDRSRARFCRMERTTRCIAALRIAESLRHASLCLATGVVLLGLAAGRVAAQSDPAAAAEANSAVEPTERIAADEEVLVIGQRPLRDFRVQVQLARERVFGLFNSLNSDDKFDITCINAPMTGTRIPQRVCRPQYADSATSDAGKEFARTLQTYCGGGITEECLQLGNSRAQGIVSRVNVGDLQLDAEMARLVRENPEFRRAIAEYQAVERRYDQARRVPPSGVSVSASIIEPLSGRIPSGLTVRRSGIDPPEPVDLAASAVSWSNATTQEPREAWIKLRFSVLADGRTANVRVVDTLPLDIDRANAIDVVETWRFTPAEDAGTPIDWHNHLAIITVKREDPVHAGWPEFADAYDEAASLAAAGSYAEAKDINQRMLSELAATLDEMAFAQVQLAVIERALGNTHAALVAIRRATESAVAQLAEDELKLALEQRFAIEIDLGLAADALETYERRVALGRWPTSDPMARVGAELERSLRAPTTTLAEEAQIGADGQWEHALIWPTFAVSDLAGQTDGLEVECNRGKAALDIEEEVQITIPAGWGNCALRVNGSAGTTFIVHQLKEPVL